MKTVFFVRHAKSSWENPSLADIDRPLNKRGMYDGPMMAEILKQKELVPALLLVSPAKRTQITAKYFSKAFSIPDHNVLVKNQIYGAFPDDLLKIIHAVDSKIESIMLFGHNPTLTNLANRFSEEYIDNVPTCGIVKITANIKDWADFTYTKGKLLYHIYPKMYKSK